MLWDIRLSNIFYFLTYVLSSFEITYKGVVLQCLSVLTHYQLLDLYLLKLEYG